MPYTKQDTLTHSEALQILRALQYGAQKARSIHFENGRTEEEGAEIFPWLYGANSLVPALTTVIERAEAGTPIDPLFLFNVLTIGWKSAQPMIYGAALTGTAIPDVREHFPAWVAGWTPEDV